MPKPTSLHPMSGWLANCLGSFAARSAPRTKEQQFSGQSDCTEAPRILTVSSSLRSEMARGLRTRERVRMSSRLWLAVAFVLAFGASPARAETNLLAVTLD